MPVPVGGAPAPAGCARAPLPAVPSPPAPPPKVGVLDDTARPPPGAIWFTGESSPLDERPVKMSLSSPASCLASPYLTRYTFPPALAVSALSSRAIQVAAVRRNSG